YAAAGSGGTDWRPMLDEEASRGKLMNALKFATATPSHAGSHHHHHHHNNFVPPLASGTYVKFATSVVRCMRTSGNEEEASGMTIVSTLADAIAKDKANPRPFFMTEAISFLACCGSLTPSQRKHVWELRAGLIAKSILPNLVPIPTAQDGTF